MVLLTIYHLRSASSHILWYLVGYAVRACIDLGLHRRLCEGTLDAYSVQMRRRLFWTVYCLDCVVSTTIGRPLALSYRHIDLDFPAERQIRRHEVLPSGDHTAQSREQRESLEMPLFFFELRRLEAEIYDAIYSPNQSLASTSPEVPRLLQRLDGLKLALDRWPNDHKDENAIIMHHTTAMHWNRAVCLLLRPFLSVLHPADKHYQACLQAAGAICQVQKWLQIHDDGHSFIAVQTIFVAAVTILHCLWTHTTQVWSVSLSNNIRACSFVLGIMSERTGWVKKYRDAFEVLTAATMEKLDGKLVGNGTIMESAEAIMISQNGFAAPGANSAAAIGAGICDMDGTHDFGTFAACSNVGGSQNESTEAMAVISELADWLDQRTSTPVWMPDFERLENAFN